MRSDMDKVIVETSRRGLRQTRKVWRTAPLDYFPHKIGMRRAHAERSYRRGNDDHLAPLRRFLRSRCGRRWDDVWAEICAVTDVRSAVQEHVRIHVPDTVAINTQVGADGRIWVSERDWRGPSPLDDTAYDLFVDPVDRVLKVNIFRRNWHKARRDRAAAATAERSARMRPVSDNVQLHKFGERGWWEVRLARLAHEGEYTPHGRYGYHWECNPFPADDVVYRAGLSTLPRVQLYGRTGVIAHAKRQLSKRDIKRLKLGQ